VPHVFRETRRDVDARFLVEGLTSDIGAGRIADALVRAGEIESALADARAAQTSTAMALTDSLAAAVLDGRARDDRATRMARSLERSGTLSVVPPEGFSYYGLHPRDFADRTALPPLAGLDRVAVVGLRSIGTTLSAVVCAAVRKRYGNAERRTVRPGGDPCARVTTLEPDDVRWVRKNASLGAVFVVADEGPGLSGSSLLSVVDALVAAGVPVDRVLVVCTRAPDPATLSAADAARRWSKLRLAVVSPDRPMADGYVCLPPGAWRSRFLPPQASWPACWPWMERRKAISHDGQVLLKFEGLGRYGAAAAWRASVLQHAGFGPHARHAGDGWIAYDVVPGHASSPHAVDTFVVDRLAEYCAWRSSALRHDGHVDVASIRRTAQGNAVAALGRDIELDLDVARPVIADGRMMPYEWVAGAALLKTDGTAHGDDHLLPGPADAVWDIAGAIVEWRLPLHAVDRLLDRYVRRSGDHGVRGRLGPWLLAYALHGIARCMLAAPTCTDGVEGGRLEREADARLRWLRAAAGRRLLGSAGAALAA
jgi:hypothetical protein